MMQQSISFGKKDTTMHLIDTHSHIDDPRFDHDRRLVIQRAEAAGVTTQIVPAIQSAWWPRLKGYCDSHSGLLPAYGLHPMVVAQHRESDPELLAEWLQREPAVAVGECGLDFYTDKLDRALQYFYFEAQLDLARQLDLPLIIHARRSVEDVIRILKQKPGLRGVLHSFSGSHEQAVRLIDLGFMMGFGGPITYPRATRLQRLVKTLPLDAILLETDSPDQPDSYHHKQRNEPANLKLIARYISSLRGIRINSLIKTTSQNAWQLFNLPLKNPAW